MVEDLANISGVDDGDDATKMILCGANNDGVLDQLLEQSTSKPKKKPNVSTWTISFLFTYYFLLRF